MKRKTITLEIDEVTVVRRRKKAAYILCKDCDDAAMMVTIDEAAAQVGSSPKKILGLICDGKVHFAQVSGGVLLVCTRSLRDSNTESRENTTKA